MIEFGCSCRKRVVDLSAHGVAKPFPEVRDSHVSIGR